jgi:hypothetical protein
MAEGDILTGGESGNSNPAPTGTGASGSASALGAAAPGQGDGAAAGTPTPGGTPDNLPKDGGNVSGGSPQGNAQAITGKWYDTLPEDIRGNERLTKFGTQEEALKAFATAKLSEELPSDYEIPSSAHPGWKDFAKQEGLTQKQLNSVLGVLTNADLVREENKKKAYGQEMKALKEEWGEKTTEKVKTANRVFEVIPSGKALLDYLKKNGEVNNPMVVKVLSEFGELVKEGSFIRSGSANGGVGNTKDIAHRWYPSNAPQ